MAPIFTGNLFGFGYVPTEGIAAGSLRFNSADNTYLDRTFSTGNRKTWTWAGWVKRSGLGTVQDIFSVNGTSDATFMDLRFRSDDTLQVGNWSTLILVTSQVFRDPSSWYHIVWSLDSTQATASDRCKLYVNGVEVTAFSTDARSSQISQNTDYGINNAAAHNIGRHAQTSDSYYSGYLADIHFIDGQALDPTSFGEFDSYGIWDPIEYIGTYGTNGFHLAFSNNSSVSALGRDTSGKGNNWTPNNFSVTAGAGKDSLLDSHTNGDTADDTGLGGQVLANYATLNPLNKHSAGNDTISNGNLDCSMVSGSAGLAPSTIGFSSGKFYYEVVWSDNAAYGVIGIRRSDSRNFNNTYFYVGTGTKYINAGSATSYGNSFVNGDVIGCAVDMDAGTLTFYKNGASQGQAFTGISGTYTFIQGIFGGTTGAYSVNFGQRPFAYTAPSGFKALCTANLPAPSVTKPSTVMDVNLYMGNGSTQVITTGFSPDFIWLKDRGQARSHRLIDTVRGIQYQLFSDTTDGGNTYDASSYVSSVIATSSTGFTVDGTGADAYNELNKSYVAWTWDAGSSTVTNTQGSITSSVRANPSAGFSIVTYTGNGSTCTVGHGLGVAPQFIIYKIRNASSSWQVYHASPGATKYLNLDTTDAVTTSSTRWNDTTPSSTVVSLGTNGAQSYDYVMYCFAPVSGYSAMGSYTGNGSSTDGPFVFCNFRPRFLLIKRTDTSGYPWVIVDAARDGYNLTYKWLEPNSSSAEQTTQPVADVDFLSNGFKLRGNGNTTNQSSGTYIYFAVAESPFQYARAR